MQILRHNCGLCVAHTLHNAYSFIRSLQHRGREAAGIAAIGKNTITVIKWKGSVNRFDITDLHKIFPSPLFHTYFAHVRYATRGRKDQILKDAQPIGIGGRVINNGDHLIILDCDAIIIHNGQVDTNSLALPPQTKLKTGSDTEALLYYLLENGPEKTLQSIHGAYTLAYASKDQPEEITVLRDSLGIKPGILGWKDGNYGVASEDIAYRDNGGEYAEDLDPGTIYYLRSDGSYYKKPVVDKQPRHCFFEWNYLADVNSILNGIAVRRLRESLGELLPALPSDLVTCIPRCPQVAARCYAKKQNIPYTSVYFKTRDERSFLGSTSEERRESIRKNLFLLPFVRGQAGQVIPSPRFLQGKRLTIIDDSIIRGNNSRHASNLVREMRKVASLDFVSYTPPIGIIGQDGIPRGCLFGVDMPPTDSFIARNHSYEEISEIIGMNVHYLNLSQMLTAYQKLGMPPENLCTFCVGGPHPFE